MSDSHNTYRQKHETERSDAQIEEIAAQIEQSRTNGEANAIMRQLGKRALLAEKQANELRKALTEADGGKDVPVDSNLPGSEKKSQAEFRKNRKSEKKEAIRLEWDKIESRTLKLDQDRLLLTEEKQSLEEEKQALKKKMRIFLMQVLRESAKLKKKDTSSSAHGEMPVAGDWEAQGGYAASPLCVAMDLATDTEDGKYIRSLGEEMEMADNSDEEDEGHYRSITPVLPPASPIDTANTGCLSLTRGAHQREKSWSDGTEEKPNIQETLRQIEMEPIGKAHYIDAICEAKERRAYHRSPASDTRLLAWALCIFMLAVGTAMTIAASLYLQETKKERNLWLEANGLTRAYLLAKAPAGDVD